MERKILGEYNRKCMRKIVPHVVTSVRALYPSSPPPELSDGTSILWTPTAALMTRGMIVELSGIYFNADFFFEVEGFTF